MGGEWQETTFANAVSIQRGHDLPEQTRKPGNIPVVGSAGPNGWHNEALARGPGIVIGRSGASAGQVTYVREDFWPHNTTLYVTDFRGNNPLYLFYLLGTLGLPNHAGGSAQPSLNRNHLAQLAVRIPTRCEQDCIAELLGALDDKIELNRRMAETLEATARALFKSWFVDSDPVRAKADSRPTCLSNDLAALFPNRFQEDGLPEGWQTCTLYDFSHVVYGTPFASASFNNSGVGLPLIRIRDLAAHNPDIFTDEEHRTAHVIKPGDIVVGMDGEFRCHFWRGPNAYLNQRLCHFEPVGGVPRSFIALALHEPLARFEAGAVGTTVIHLGKQDLDTVTLVHPGKQILAAFGWVSEPLIDQAISAALQCRTLAAVRETLLLKLISGELRIRDAERAVAAA